MKQIILGTAGHIDHGKTSLIKAISGTDTDRLKEEKLRGITIELGFASLDLPSGQHIGIVDVPGHEKFVKNMVAGATGIDLVVMVIAADEGVMPQTREHMEICKLLDIKHGFVALTKIDLVDEEWLELVLEDVKDFTQGSFLEDAPIVPVSSATGEGISEFIQTLDEISAQIPSRSPSGLFRLPVDRVFTMKGFGTVITGTLTSGKVHAGDTVMLYPSRITSKVRGIQVHDESKEEAQAGMRTAINFQGLDKEAVNRGDVLAHAATLKLSYMLDISLHYLQSNDKPLKNRTVVRCHAGTSEVLGNLILLDREELLPGETTIAQLRLDSPMALIKDDRFVIRSYSPIRTIGGGHIINPIPQKHKRFKDEIIEGLLTLSEQSVEGIITLHASHAGYNGVSFADLRLMTNLPEKKLHQHLQTLLSQRALVQVDKENRIYVHHETFSHLQQEAHRHLSAYHHKFPLKGGMPKEELKSKYPSILTGKIFNLIILQMIKGKELIQEEDTVRLASHKVSLAVGQQDIQDKILNTYHDSKLQPPYFKEITKTLGLEPSQAKDVLMLIVEKGDIIKVKEDLYYHKKPLQKLQQQLIDYLKANGEITTPQFKEMTGASRKFVIPLIEYFDSQKITIRIGDIRKLRKETSG